MTSVSIGLVSHPEDGLSAEELMSAADRAMYQAKRLGKNQISGNPRPRPALLARRSTSWSSRRREPPPAAPGPACRPAHRRRSAARSRAVAVDGANRRIARWRSSWDRSSSPSPAGSRHEEVDDADPQEVRRRIASASRSFDPDHQIRRAMDAFLSPVPRERDHDRPSADN